MVLPLWNLTTEKTYSCKDYSFKAMLKIKADDFSKQKITEILADRKLTGEEIQSFIVLLENCEVARYSPATDAKMQQDFDQALSVISNIDKKL